VDAVAAALVGAKTRVLLERREEAEGETIWIGRTRRQAPEADGVVYVAGVGAHAAAGDMVSARYTGQLEYDLTAGAVDLR